MSTVNGAYLYRDSTRLLDLNQAIMRARTDEPPCCAWLVTYSCGHRDRHRDRPGRDMRFKVCRRCAVRRTIASVSPVNGT
jgi:hypothetical protein